MNLNQIVSGAVGAINPRVPIRVRVSTGYSIADDGKPVPTYAAVQIVPGQVQSLTYDDLRQIDGLNIQGIKRAIYLNGRIDGIVRLQDKGGDLITVPTAQFVGSISGTTMSVGSVGSGRLSLGDEVYADGLAAGTRIAALGSGLGYAGTYQVSIEQEVASAQMASGTVWLVVEVLEYWPDWCKVVATMQDGS